MAERRSAGLLMFRRREDGISVLLAHPGGPYFSRRDSGHWSIPKGEYAEDEDPLAAGQREFLEETGFAPAGPFIDLGEIRQKGGKLVRAWAFEADADAAAMRSNTFEMEWPPRSGLMRVFPEVDRCEFFKLEEARKRIKPAQIPLIDSLADHLNRL